jgi:host factor-I protein
MDSKKQPAQNKDAVQNQYLDTFIKDQVPVSVYLVNGIRLVGILASHDSFTLMVRGKTGAPPQVTFKSAVSTVLPEQRR